VGGRGRWAGVSALKGVQTLHGRPGDRPFRPCPAALHRAQTGALAYGGVAEPWRRSRRIWSMSSSAVPRAGPLWPGKSAPRSLWWPAYHPICQVLEHYGSAAEPLPLGLLKAPTTRPKLNVCPPGRWLRSSASGAIQHTALGNGALHRNLFRRSLRQSRQCGRTLIGACSRRDKPCCFYGRRLSAEKTVSRISARGSMHAPGPSGR